MTDDELTSDLEELSSAEDFLEYFEVEYDPKVVQVNRLHILQRFHDYLSGVETLPSDAGERWTLHADLLDAAYQDFVASNPLTEKVFRVFHTRGPRPVTVDISDLTSKIPHAS